MMLSNPETKYRPFSLGIDMRDRTWPDKITTKAPRWRSTDLRDGNQALADPMDVDKKLMFIKLLEHFPRFEMSAYLLVSVIGAKLTADFAINTPEHPHVLNMHDPGDWAFWLFWGLMLACFIVGFVPGQAKKFKATDAHG